MANFAGFSKLMIVFFVLEFSDLSTHLLLHSGILSSLTTTPVPSSPRFGRVTFNRNTREERSHMLCTSAPYTHATRARHMSCTSAPLRSRHMHTTNMLCTSVPLHARHTHMAHMLCTSAPLQARHTRTTHMLCTSAPYTHATRTRHTCCARVHPYTHTTRVVHECTPRRTPHAYDTCSTVHPYAHDTSKRKMLCTSAKHVLCACRGALVHHMCYMRVACV